jgi:hypothetical protein
MWMGKTDKEEKHAGHVQFSAQKQFRDETRAESSMPLLKMTAKAKAPAKRSAEPSGHEEIKTSMAGLQLPPGVQCEAFSDCWCQTRAGSRSHVIVGQFGYQGRTHWQQGAGLVVFREGYGQHAEALVVHGKKQTLSFPKGGRKGNEGALQNALRVWHEETGLTSKHLAIYKDIVLADSRFGCHYFLAQWLMPYSGDEPMSWKPPAEDPNDQDPILVARWMRVEALCNHNDLNGARKQLLKLAAQLTLVLPCPTAGAAYPTEQ